MGTKKEKLYCLWCAVPGGRANDVPDEEVSLDTGCHQVCVPMSMFMRVYVMCYVMCLCSCVCVRTYDSEDSDFWTMGAREWHAGYSTRSRKQYRHVIQNETKSRFLGKMPTAERLVEVVCATHPQTVTCLFDLVCCVFTRSCNPNPRIRFAMWTGNDYLPSFEGVGWQKAKELHKKFEALNDAEEEVRMCTHTITCLSYLCVGHPPISCGYTVPGFTAVGTH